MVKVITYGTYDLLHYGHIRLLKRAKALGDYFIVGVTADAFDMARGKINVQQSLMERIEAIRSTGLADEIIVEEFEGQKIDDIRRLNVDVFAIGSDWYGHFDYLKKFCKVVYLDRTEGVSSSEIRAERQELRMGIVGESALLNKFLTESRFVNGVRIVGYCSKDDAAFSAELKALPVKTNKLEMLLPVVDAVYIVSHPTLHYTQIKQALLNGKHVICESPIAVNAGQYKELRTLAKECGLVLMDALKTAYSTAYYRMLLLAKSGIIGDIVSVDSICTSLSELENQRGKDFSTIWSSICAWGPTAMLPIFQLLGINYSSKSMVSRMDKIHKGFDLFTQITFTYPYAVASLKVGKGVKSEGELIVSGSKGYIYIPAPWWKTDYFEIRYENPTNNKRYFYRLEGEGIRYEIVNFVKEIQLKKSNSYVSDEVSYSIVKVIDDYFSDKSVIII